MKIAFYIAIFNFKQKFKKMIDENGHIVYNLQGNCQALYGCYSRKNAKDLLYYSIEYKMRNFCIRIKSQMVAWIYITSMNILAIFAYLHQQNNYWYIQPFFVIETLIFTQIAKTYGLNWFLKMIWCIVKADHFTPSEHSEVTAYI